MQPDSEVKTCWRRKLRGGDGRDPTSQPKRAIEALRITKPGMEFFLCIGILIEKVREKEKMVNRHLN